MVYYKPMSAARKFFGTQQDWILSNEEFFGDIETDHEGVWEGIDPEPTRCLYCNIKKVKGAKGCPHLKS